MSSLLLFVCLLGIPWLSAETNHSIHHPHIVHDTIEPPKRNDEHATFTNTYQFPDWSDAKLTRHYYIEMLLAVDASVSRYYGHDREKILAALTTLMHAVNMYAYKLNIHIVVVDVVPVRGYNLSLEQFLDWRQETDGLTSHDVAMLIRHRYEGGIAYVDGICKRTSVGICGFFPEAPHEYASVFFHELAHVLGLSHDMTTKCSCSKKNKNNCLRIDGFDKDCSAQALVELLPKTTCLSYPTEELPRTTMSVCGNGVVEDEEECDCGPDGHCDNIFCQARSCRFVIEKKYLYSTITFGTAAFIFLILLVIRRVFCMKYKDNTSTISLLGKPPQKYNISQMTSHISPVSTLPKLKSNPEMSILQDVPVQLPSLAPIRPAPKWPNPLCLDMQVPVIPDNNLPSEYVKMNPVKNPKVDIENVRLPVINQPNPNLSYSSSSSSLKASLDLIRQMNTKEKNDKKLEISDPVAVIVASRPAEDFLEAWEESTKTRRTKKDSDDFAKEPKSSHRPTVPDRRTKPSMTVLGQISLGDCPIPGNKKNLYDLPPLS